jgi:hypothetical protein
VVGHFCELGVAALGGALVGGFGAFVVAVFGEEGGEVVALTDALVLMALAMTTARTLSLVARSQIAARPESVRIADSGM